MRGKLILLLAAAFISVFALSGFVNPGGGGGGSTEMPRTISVNGNGKSILTPDVATINVGVHSENVDVAAALNENTTLAQSVAEALQGFGVDSKDIQTTNFAIYPSQQYGPQGEMLELKYAVDNTVLITVRDLTKMGDILTTVVSKGANNIYGITFDVSDRTKALSDARIAAITDANTQAKALADAAGVKLGQVSNINVSVSTPPQPLYNAYGGMGGGGGMAAAPAPISSGQLTINVDVYVTYEISK